MLRRLRPVLVACSVAAVACGAEHVPWVEPDVGPSDGGPDAPLECGDERGPIEIPPAPIVNGTESFDPTVVSLTEGQVLAVGAVLQQVEPPTWENVCTATLIGPDLVLTAAHCLLDFWTEAPLAPHEVRFAVGVDAAAPEHVYDVAISAPHPDYDLWVEEAIYDVGVLVLAEPAVVAMPGIQIIPMNCETVVASAFVGQRVQNVGYGMTDPDDWWSPPNTRRWWTVEEVTALSYYDFTVDGFGLTGVCYGDSGGPSLWTSSIDGVVRVMGVVSWGDPTCVDEDHFALSSYHCGYVDEFRDGCGEVTERGRCVGEVAEYCEAGSLVRVDCSASGGLCVDDGTSRVWCRSPEPCTEEGRCEGDVAIYCVDDVEYHLDCAAMGLVCGLDAEGRYRCLDDACAGLDFAGRCEEEVAAWCEDGSQIRVDCASAGLVCRATGAGLHRCLDDPCHGLDWAGRCAGDHAIWCEDGEVRMRNCEACGQRCGWSEPYGGYYCL